MGLQYKIGQKATVSGGYVIIEKILRDTAFLRFIMKNQNDNLHDTVREYSHYDINEHYRINLIKPKWEINYGKV